MSSLSHFDETGASRMVDVAAKEALFDLPDEHTRRSELLEWAVCHPIAERGYRHYLTDVAQRFEATGHAPRLMGC